MGKRLNHDSCCHVEGICHPDATPAGDGLGPSDYIAALCKQLAEKGAQIEDMEREIEQLARGVSITNAADIAALKRDLQSANERIEALTAERDAAKAMAEKFMKENDHVYEQVDKYVDTSDTLSEKLLALQRAVREYMKKPHAVRYENENCQCAACQALMDLLK